MVAKGPKFEQLSNRNNDTALSILVLSRCAVSYEVSFFLSSLLNCFKCEIHCRKASFVLPSSLFSAYK